MAVRTNRHAVFDLEYHLVVVTKYRRPALTGPLEKRAAEIVYSIFEDHYGCKVHAVNANVDHIHILFEAPPQVQLSKLVNSYNTVSSRLLRKEFPDEVFRFYVNSAFWSQSYFICTVSERSEAAVKHYIETQKEAANPS